MKPQIGLQLYTLRDQFATDFHGTLRRVAELGYQGVETAFFGENITAKDAARQFRELGLTVIAAHSPLPLGETREAALALWEDLSCRRAVWHGWPQDMRYATLAGIQELAEEYNAAHAIAQSQGVLFGLHNHWWEFEDVKDQTPYDLLRSLLHPDIFFELDTYWIQTAGRNPAMIVAGAGSRAPLLHIKDGPAVQDAPMVAAGSGVLDIPSIVHASGENAEWLIVELDACAGDIWQALEESFRYLTENAFVRLD